MHLRLRRAGTVGSHKPNWPRDPGVCPRKRLAAILTVLFRYQGSSARFNRFFSFGP